MTFLVLFTLVLTTHNNQNFVDIMDVIPPRQRKKQRKPNIKSTETDVARPETNDQFSKRELVSNWNKYADQAPSSDADAPHTSNFEELLSNPASVGGHFLFNSEKGWESSDDWYNRDDYFQLNLIELGKSFASIPFYERQGYSQSIFSSEEIDEMNRQAKYQLFKLQSKSNDTLNSGSAINVQCETIEKPSHNVDRLQLNDDDDLDELLNLTGTGQYKAQSSNYSTTSSQPTVSSVAIQPVHSLGILKSTDDIQKWLDDVLILDS